MNKAQLVDALTARLGDRRTAAAAVDGVVDVIVETVGAGDSVTLTGFGVFEARRRAARVARNPRTGETVPVPETVVPSFRAGAAFRDRIGDSDAAAVGATSAPRRTPRPSTGVTSSAAGKPAAGKPAAKAGTAKPAAKKKSTAGASAADKAATAKGATAKSPASKPAAAKSAKSSTKGTSTAKKAPSRRSTAEK